MRCVERPSPNYNARQAPVTMIVLHYTGMESAEAALDRLCDPAAEVSAHYVVDEDGTVYRLVAEVKDRHEITRGNVVGHSDIAPTRKRDPGELFPWHRLARLRLALPRPTKNLMDPEWGEAAFCLALERFGYDVTDRMAAIMAFQRRFRPELIDGEIDAECRMILLALLLPRPQGDD